MNENLKHTVSKVIENVSSSSTNIEIEQAFEYANVFFDCLFHTQLITSLELIDLNSELQSAYHNSHSVRRDAECDLDQVLQG